MSTHREGPASSRAWNPARLSWTVNRLRAMNAGEVGFRLGRKIQGTAERLGLGRVRERAAAGPSGAPWVEVLPTQFDPAGYLRAADRVLAGQWDVFALEKLELGFPPRWNVDPRTGTEAPLRFGKTIDYRDPRLVGDIKYLWELSRHLELVTLAQAWHLSADARYAQGCRTLVESWIEQCPYPLGVHWCVSLEHGIRLCNWACAWQLLGGDRSPLFAGTEGEVFRARWLRSIRQHCHFVDTHFSRHSSANNHLIGEATGLLVASVTWPMWPESREWQAHARVELEREALLQVAPDGVNREQAVWYHHAVADMLLVAGLFARANGAPLSAAVSARLEGMLVFLASIMDAGGHVPQFGDADDGVLVRFAPDDDAPDTRLDRLCRSLLATGAVLFHRPDFARKAGGFDDKSRWLLGDAAAAPAQPGAPAFTFPPRRAFPDGGYYVLGSDFETAREVRIVADAGPLGYLSLAAHGHADALSFTLSVGGLPMLVDPGTYAYHTEREWRDYFRSTRAHNTVSVDGENQSVIGGNFLWLARAHARVEDLELEGAVQRLVAVHDGYRRLAEPVLQRRTLRYDSAARRLQVIDRFECTGEHCFATHWHFAPACQVMRAGHDVAASCGSAVVRLSPPPGVDVLLTRARDAPILGWYSHRFGVRQPATVAHATVRAQGPLQLEWQLQC